MENQSEEIDWEKLKIWAMKCVGSRRLKTIPSRYADIRYPDGFYLVIDSMTIDDLIKEYKTNIDFRNKINALKI